MKVGFRRSEGMAKGEIQRLSGGLSYSRICKECKEPKSMVGGTNRRNRFVCKACSITLGLLKEI